MPKKMPHKVPNGSKRDVSKFLKELTALTLKYGIMVEACSEQIPDPEPTFSYGLYLNGYATGRTLAGQIEFVDDHYRIVP